MRNSNNTHGSTALPARGSLAAGLLCAVLQAAGVQAQGECASPEMPEMPDGASASLEEMLDGQKAVKTFQAANMDYMQCLEARFTAAKEAVQDGGDRDAAAVYEEAVEAYNAAVNAEEEVAGQFNVELREYKAANK